MSEVRDFHSDKEALIQSLRQQTAASHQKLEDNYLSKMLLDDEVDILHYQNYLSALYGVTLGCETSLFPHIKGIVRDLEARKRSQLIESDLLSTGLTREQIEDIPVYIFPFSSVAEAMGAMYVLEGSTLGGRMLYKHIHKKLGLTAENGCSYFWGYGEQTGNMWKSFVSSFTQYALETGQSAAVIAGAVDTFTTIDNWLNEAVIEK